jgi:hypothetical protein
VGIVEPFFRLIRKQAEWFVVADLMRDRAAAGLGTLGSRVSLSGPLPAHQPARDGTLETRALVRLVTRLARTEEGLRVPGEIETYNS